MPDLAEHQAARDRRDSRDTDPGSQDNSEEQMRLREAHARALERQMEEARASFEEDRRLDRAIHGGPRLLLQSRDQNFLGGREVGQESACQSSFNRNERNG